MENYDKHTSYTGIDYTGIDYTGIDYTGIERDHG